VHVPYRGAAAALADVEAGQVPVMFSALSVALGRIQAKRLTALAVATPVRTPLLPEVPTIAESGLDGYEFGNWHALFAPKGTPDKRVRLLNKAIVQIFEKPEIRDLVLARGSEIVTGSPEELAETLKRDIPKYKKLMVEAGIVPQ